jgi:uncharacterized phiE125 gp8 family phage protein
MALKLKTAPALTPVTLAEAKAHLRFSETDDDTLITGLINAATSYLDGTAGIMGRCLVSQVWELYYDAFPAGDLQIPLGNLLAVGSVEYVDPITKLYVTWPALNNYETDLISKEGWVIPVKAWPTPAETSNAVRITFTAGFGPASADVPAAVRQAMLLMIGHWYENRETVAIGQTVAELPMAATTLLAPFRRVGV